MPLRFLTALLASALPVAALTGGHESTNTHPAFTSIVRLTTPQGLTASGVLLKSRRHILTAAHSVQPHELANPTRGRAHFHSDHQFPWLHIHLHPQRNAVWDIALIELAQDVPASISEGLSLSHQPAPLHTSLIFVGFGRRGTGQFGDHLPHGRLSWGTNSFDLRLTPSLAQFLQLPSSGPLLLHDFDTIPQAEDPIARLAKARNIKTTTSSIVTSHECHFGTGDSGGAGLLLTKEQGATLVSIHLGRHRGLADSDHRLNGSHGELGLSLDVHALLPWLETFGINNE